MNSKIVILTIYLISIIYITDMLPQHPISTTKLISDYFYLWL